MVLAKLSAFLRGQGPCWSCSCRQGPCTLGSLAARMEMSCVAHTRILSMSYQLEVNHGRRVITIITPRPKPETFARRSRSSEQQGKVQEWRFTDSGARVAVGPFEPGKLVGFETPFV